MFVGRVTPLRGLLFLAIALILGLLLASRILVPVRERIADRYVARGDARFAAIDFDGAEAEYGRALGYDPDNRMAQERLDQVRSARTDAAAAEEFYRERGVAEATERLERARGPFATPKQALSTGVSLYDEGQYSYARYSLEQAVEMDPAYPEAWHYLGLIYRELAKDDPAYAAKADACWEKRDGLTPMYLAPR